MERTEAIKILKEFHDKSALFSMRTALDVIIPELHESEDERIRKEIIEYLKSKYESPNAIECDYEKWIAWLEKQGHTDSIIEKAKTEKQRVIITETDGNANIDWDTRSLEDARKLLECGLLYINTELEKQGKQKHAIDIEIPFGAKDSELQEATYLIPEGFHAEINDKEVLIKKGST